MQQVLGVSPRPALDVEHGFDLSLFNPDMHEDIASVRLDVSTPGQTTAEIMFIYERVIFLRVKLDRVWCDWPDIISPKTLADIGDVLNAELKSRDLAMTPSTVGVLISFDGENTAVAPALLRQLCLNASGVSYERWPDFDTPGRR